ncbi:MAG: galactokinase, partial [Myxococcales bacterium]|nr:galactokinase [Myxococcales bacterium]
RVNLMGEHTDYNDGYVLPTAIPQRTRVELAPRADGIVRVVSTSVDGPAVTYHLGDERARGDWVDFVGGITFVLRSAGSPISGFDARVTSEVPIGSGLSSSAALSIALLRALRSAFGLPLDDLQLPRLARRSENEFVGAPVGIMDPMACHFCDERTALFLDTRSLRSERVDLPPSAEIVVIDSGVAHRHSTGGYRARRAECTRACETLGVASLRELGESALPRVMRLPDPLGRRVRHVIRENARVLLSVEAMRRGDLRALGALFDESHASMRDDYEVSAEGVDRLAAIARRAPGVHGARLTGGGFGGAVVAVVDRGCGRHAAKTIAEGYAAGSSETPVVLVPPTG